MSAPKLKSKDLVLCVKCGNVMVERKIRTHNSNAIEFQKVMQCIVCKFWFPEE